MVWGIGHQNGCPIPDKGPLEPLIIVGRNICVMVVSVLEIKYGTQEIVNSLLVHERQYSILARSPFMKWGKTLPLTS